MKKEKMDVYQIITNQIVKRLEDGCVPWKQPYHIEVAKNLVTGKVYKGINEFILNGLFPSPYYLTFKQCKELGGTIKKGEAGIPVVFWNMKDVKTKETKIVDGEEVTETKLKTMPFLRYYTVFNATQCEGITHKRLSEAREAVGYNPDIESAEKIIAGYENKPVMKFMETIPCYVPALDEIRVPTKDKFDSIEEYYATVFHEMVHSTGHEKRLNRDMKFFKDDKESYSKEELVAELGACYLSKTAMINVPIDNSSAYINGWINAIKGDKKLLVSAVSKSRKAVEYIINK